MNDFEEVNLDLQDEEWPFEYTDEDREIVRAIVFDESANFYFVQVERNDYFGNGTFIETSGGGVEKGENLEEALKRELKEELGLEAEVLCRLGVVRDYYNLIHRHNINNYFLCRAVSFGEKNLTEEEIRDFHLSTMKLSYGEAIKRYEAGRSSKWGRLLAARELPILKKAGEILGEKFTNL